MPTIGPLEIVIVLVIALVIFGPRRLPNLGRSVGQGVREFKDTLSFDKRDDESDGREQLAQNDPKNRSAAGAAGPRD